MNNGNLCLGCMNAKGNEPECPRCGYVEKTPQVLPGLAAGTVLAQRYLVGKRLRINGEGFTYIAMDQQTGRKIELREYLPQNLCTRQKGSDTVIVNGDALEVYEDYLSDFIDVSKALARLGKNSSISRALDIFECNNTAYAVYDYIDGKSLAELVKRAKRLTWEEAAPLFLPLISSMSAAHALGLVHFGINPESVVMNRAGALVITNFGVPDARITETELVPEMFDGFCAIEQYSIDGKKGRWTDVYAMCAVILYAITGKCPPNSVERARDARLNISSEIAETIPTYVITALARGLQVYGENRTSSMDELKHELSDSIGEQRTPAPRPAQHGQQYQQRQQRVPAPQRPPQAEPQRRERPPQAEPQRRERPPQGRGSGFSNAARNFGGRVSGFFNQGRGNGERRGAKSANGTPWYQNLSQWQYALLSASLTIVVLGTIAVIVFLSVRPHLSGDEGKTKNPVQYIDNTSESDVADPTKLYEVPDLVEKEWNVSLRDQYIVFDITVVAEEYSDDYPKGYIIRQSVQKGSQIAMGSPIGITISRGSKMCKVPDIIGKTVSQAYDALTDVGLGIGAQTEEYSDVYPQGQIIRINGASVGASVQRDSLISFVVSLGPEE